MRSGSAFVSARRLGVAGVSRRMRRFAEGSARGAVAGWPRFGQNAPLRRPPERGNALISAGNVKAGRSPLPLVERGAFSAIAQPIPRA